MLSNNPPPAAELYAEEIESLKSRASDMVLEGVTEDNAGAASDLVKLGGKLSRDIDKARKEEKEPHLEAGRAVDGIYNPLKANATKAVDPLKQALAEYLKEQQRQAAEARAEAERIAREEADRAAALADDALVGEAAQENAAQAQADAELAAAAEKARASVKGSAGFRAASFRKTYRANVTDPAALVAHYAGHPDVIAAAEKLAGAAVRAAKGAPVNIPGVEVETVETLV